MTFNRNVLLRLDRLCDRRGEALAIDSKRIAGGNTRLLTASDDERIEELHFAFEEADGVGDRRRAERIRADQLREIGCLVRRRHLRRPHFEEVDGVTALRELNSAFGGG